MRQSTLTSKLKPAAGSSAAEFAGILKDRGYNAYSKLTQEQLALLNGAFVQPPKLGGGDFKFRFVEIIETARRKI